MLNEFSSNVAAVIKNRDIHELIADGAGNLLIGLLTKDLTVIPSIAQDAVKIALSVPNIIFADKLYRFFEKGFPNNKQKAKFVERLEKDNHKYEETVKIILQIIDKIDFNEKIDWFAYLTISFSSGCIDRDKYIKLSTAISMLMVDDLNALKQYYGKTNVPENSTLSNYYAYGLTTKIIPTGYGTSIAKHTLSTSGIELLKYSIDYENCEKYQVPKEKQDGESE